MIKRLPVILMMLATTPALADGRTIDFSTVIVDQDGNPIPDCNAGECKDKLPLTLGAVAMRSLSATFQDEPNLGGDEKFHRGWLAMKVYKASEMSLSVEDIALIKRLIAKGYGPLIVLQAWPLLDPNVAK